jgi:hypothetical protein
MDYVETLTTGRKEMSESKTPVLAKVHKLTPRARKPKGADSTEGGKLQGLLNEQLAASPGEQVSHGRSVTGDNRSAAKPRPAAKPKPAPGAAAKPKGKQPMGPAGYRLKYGQEGARSDTEVIKTVRAWLTENKQKMTDAQILSVIGWAVTAKTAIGKVQAHLAKAA